MNSNSTIVRSAIFYTLMVLLFVPLIQGTLKVVKIKPLQGAITDLDAPTFKFSDWFSSHYQQKEEEYLNEAFGFRPFFVRLNNQLAYSLFDVAKANGVIVGKEGYLYEENYIKAYYGSDFIGEDSIQHRLERLRFVQDTLAKLNKSIMLVIAAGKGSFFPEYFPDSCHRPQGPTNVEYHAKLAQQLGVNCIDFNQYFLKLKGKSEYPLYPIHGIHWSYYGACLAADSIIRYMEAIQGIDMPNLYWNSVEMHLPQKGDSDLGDGLNILFNPSSKQLAYPNVQVESDSGKVKPNVLVVSDSFYWLMYNFGIANAFATNHFWYYNNQVYPDSFQASVDVSKLDLAAEIDKHDIFMVMATEATIPNLGWGFIENLYFHFKGIKRTQGRSPDFLKRLEAFKAYIKADAGWMAGIVKRAEKSNLSVDSVIAIDAIWQVEQQLKKEGK